MKSLSSPVSQRVRASVSEVPHGECLCVGKWTGTLRGWGRKWSRYHTSSERKGLPLVRTRVNMSELGGETSSDLLTLLEKDSTRTYALSSERKHNIIHSFRITFEARIFRLVAIISFPIITNNYRRIGFVARKLLWLLWIDFKLMVQIIGKRKPEL